MQRRLTPGRTIAVAVVSAAALAPVALATGTHQEYVAQVNPICKSAARQARKIPNQVKPTGRPLVDSLRRSSAYARLLSKTFRRIAAVDPAPGEAAQVKAWLAGSRRTVRLIRSFVRASSRGDFAKAAKLIGKTIRSQRIGQKRARRLGLTACAGSSRPG
jgi:NADPH-dependent ferric siderophore reductase